MKIVIRLDKHTTYHIDKKNCIILTLMGIRESTDPNVILIKYTKKDLKDFYSTHPGPTKLIVTEDDNYIIIDEIRNLLFIPLSNRAKTIVGYTFSNLVNLELLSPHSFCRNINGPDKVYARSTRTTGGIYMQEIIFGKKACKGYTLDHINSNSLDNRTDNIREITIGYNNANRKSKETGYDGVSWSKKHKRWHVRIKHNKNKYDLGYFVDPIDAARMRDIYSVFLYRGLKPFNKLNKEENINILSEEEIQDVLENGIPEKYIIRKKTRELPRNIYQSKNVRKESYYYNIAFRGKNYGKRFDTLQETMDALEDLKLSFKEITDKEKEIIINSINDHRNSNGNAIMLAHNAKGKVTAEIEVDDEEWKEYIHCSWYLDGGYPRGIVNGSLETLHLLIFKKYNPEYNFLEDNRSIDHIDRIKNNCMKINLRLATGSQQIQNRKLTRRKCIIYTGVDVKSGNFYVTCGLDNGNVSLGPYEYLEDAAAAYNQIALNFDKDATLNIIRDGKTTAADLFASENISLEFIENISTITELHEVFRSNPDWVIDGGIILREMRIENLQYYKDIAIDLKQSEL
jgi:hypothetical protein